jgi:hypothetical protein
MKITYSIIFILMSNKGDKLNARLVEFISTQTEKPSKKELEAAVKLVYKTKKTQDKAEKESNSSLMEKPKRKPSKYNMFYAEQSLLLKQQEEDKDTADKMTAKAKMLYIASLWKEKNGKEADEDAPELDDE